MNIEQSKKHIFLFTLYIIFICLLNYLLTPISDDFCHSFKGSGDFNHLINSIIKSYLTWNPRFGEYLVFIFYYIGKFSIFKVINSIAIILMPFLLIFIIKGKFPKITNRNDFQLIFFTSFLLLFSSAKPNHTIFWFTGSTNYLISAFILFSFLALYRTLLNKDSNFRNSISKMIFLFLFGTIAGQLSEPGSIIVAFLILLVLLYSKFVNKVKLPFWCYIGFLGILIGLSILLLSPASEIKINHFQETAYFKNWTIFDKLLNSPYTYFQFFKELPSLSIFTILLLLLQIKNKTISFHFKKMSLEVYMMIFFFLAGCASINAMIAVPSFFWAGRAFFMASIFFILFILSVFSIEKSKNWTKNIMELYIILGIFGLGMMFPEFLKANYEFNERKKYIQTMKQKDIFNLKLKKYSKRFFIRGNDITTNKNNWNNECFAKFYSLESVIVSD